MPVGSACKLNRRTGGADPSKVFIPMAIESPVLLHALIAFASANMSYFDASYEAMAIEARVKALSYLSASILDSDMAQREMNLAACLVLSTAEISLGHRKEWHSHLQGAKHVIESSFVSGHDSQLTSASEALKGTHEGRWLLRNFAYHDIMASVLSGQLLLHPDYLEGIATTIDSYFGVALDPLISVAEISSLDLAQLKHAVSRPFDLSLGIIETTWPLVTKIESNLRSWQCPHVRDSALMSMGRSFRNAALLYLYGRIHDAAPLCESLSSSTASTKSTIHDRVEAEVTKTLHHLSNIPLNGCAEGSLLFPLFLAWVATSRNVNMVTISRRIKHIVEKRGFRNFQLGLEALERIWASKSYHHGTVFGGLEWQAIQQLAGSGVTLS
ncbi:hypothetical protein FDECE_200 [Fusarium decemcellulare]|nr:hypothetical protein FDECE_200 [Fusarium decemcellulare]